MDSSLHYFQTQRTARVFTFGELNENTKFIWFLIHGYAQTADHLLENFKLFGPEHFFVAPEGLNHFYARGLSGNPVASWMTSLMREEEIKDYVNYLASVYQNFKPHSNCKVIVAGFSQGVSTLCRWIHRGGLVPNHIIFIAGNIAHEMKDSLPDIFNQSQNLFLYGSNDALVRKESVLAMNHLFEKSTEFIEFTGKHEVNENCINQIKSWLEQK